MNTRAVMAVLGQILMLMSGFLVFPIGVALVSEDGGGAVEEKEILSLLLTVVLSLALGRWLRRRAEGEIPDVGVRESLAIVAFAWVLMAALGALPFWISGQCPLYADAFFETMSGLTTTGASVIPDVEAMPHGLLFWRSLTHWIGGMGIVVFSVAVLPAMGGGGQALFRAEMSGIIRDRIKPRIADIAKTLWEVYTLLTLAQVFLLILGGQSVFDAVCNTFGSLGTGGFAVRNIGYAAYPGAYDQWIAFLFMFLGGTNFALHYDWMHGRWRKVLQDPEFRIYSAILGSATILLALILWYHGQAPGGVEMTLRTTAFQSTSVMTSTGFATVDFDRWPAAARYVMVVLMFFGGCAGSTAGGMKIIRLMLWAKIGVRELRQMISPHAVLPIKVGRHTIERDTLHNVLVFFVLYLISFAAGTLCLSFQDIDLETAATGVVACLGTVGPGLNKVGPMVNYQWMPEFSKWVLSTLMLVGRLEVFGVLVLLHPNTWRR